MDKKPVFKGNCSRCYFCQKNCAQSAITADWAGFKNHVAKLYAAHPDYLKYSDDLREYYTRHPRRL